MESRMLIPKELVIAAVREAAHDEYVLQDKVGETSKHAAACTPVVNQIVGFFAERIIDKLDSIKVVERKETSTNSASPQ